MSEEEVLRVAALARIGLAPERARRLQAELAVILDHMRVLATVDTEGVPAVVGVGASGMPLREDAGPPLPLARTPDAFAPEMRDGLFLVPRLATHESEGA